MKIIITQSTDTNADVDLDTEALGLDEYALARFMENAIQVLEAKIQNIYSSVE